MAARPESVSHAARKARVPHVLANSRPRWEGHCARSSSGIAGIGPRRSNNSSCTGGTAVRKCSASRKRWNGNCREYRCCKNHRKQPPYRGHSSLKLKVHGEGKSTVASVDDGAALTARGNSNSEGKRSRGTDNGVASHKPEARAS